MSFSRILFRFSKKGEARHLSHRDLMRLFERALRRAGLPVRMSQGFNPHPRLSIPAALPVGVEAEDEALEVEFEPPVMPQEARDRLAAELPPGVGLGSAQALPEGARTRVEAAMYEVELPVGSAPTPQDVARFLAREHVPVQRGGPGGKELDLRPALRTMSVEGNKLRFELAMAECGTPRTAEVLAALMGDAAPALASAKVRRVGLRLTIAPPRHQGVAAGTRFAEGNRDAAPTGDQRA